MLFPGGLDFDIVPVDAGPLSTRLRDPIFAGLVGAGVRVIVDKDHGLADVDVEEPGGMTAADITYEEFEFVTHDFLF